MRVLIVILFVLFPAFAIGNPAGEMPEAYKPLLERLAKDGFDYGRLSELLSDHRAEIIPERMTISLSTKEKAEIYDKFLSPESILLAKKFHQENLNLLKEAENRFHVTKEVIVAILLVESRFGESRGHHRVIPTLASMAVMDAPENLQNNYRALRKIDPELTFEWVENRARRRASWAYQELKSFLTMLRDESIDPLDVKGSYAGALGLAQFIPSSYLRFAVSQKGFENWLSDKEEAILSIANYLKLHGWKKGLSKEEKKKILWYYNRSEPYVDTVLEVAKRINR